MSTAQYLKLLAWVNGAVPGALLAWEAYHQRLGANPVNDAIRTTGLIAMVMLSLSLLVTPLRRLTGWSLLLAVRRPLGLWGFYYACVHFSLYVGLDRALDLGSTIEELLMRRYLQVGLGAIVLMIPLALTSTDAGVRLLGPRRWKLLHRLAYVAVGLAVLHYYLLVKSDVRQPLAFAGVVGLLMAARGGWHYSDLRLKARRPAQLAVPAQRPKPAFWNGQLRVARVLQETPDVRTFRLVSPDGGPLPFRHLPGQYLTLTQQVGGQRVVRCYTIASPPSRNAYCEISVKREPLGASSVWLHDHVREGDHLQIGAPAGRFVCTGEGAQHVVLIAGGVGITPLMAMARYLTDVGWPGQIDFILAARTSRGLIFHDELRWLKARCPNLRLHVVLSHADDDPHWTGARGRLSAELLNQWVGEWRTPEVYVCGPKPMMDAVTGLVHGLGTPIDRIHTEAFVSAAALERPVAPDPGTAARPVEAALRFSRAGLAGLISPDQSLLEAAEAIGADIPFECRSGICGQCKVRLLSGTVVMDADDALAASEKSQGIVLACQSHALEDLVIDG